MDMLNTLSRFFEEQLNDWSLPKKNFSDLQACITKDFWVEGNAVAVQFNPARMISTSAKVDTKSIAERKCFLCRENRPAEQKDFHFNDEYTILVNPFPIFPVHFTIPKNMHTPQVIAGEITAMYNLTKTFGGQYSVFYNGPRCGASAPDHHHFQMGSAGFMPVETHRNPDPLFKKSIHHNNNYSVQFVNDGLRSFVEFTLADSSSEQAYIDAMERFIAFYTVYMQKNIEPMLNIISYMEMSTGNIVFLFLLRSKHRPARYFSEGPDAMIISPASVDVGGKIITPRREDFDRITEQDIKEMFAEVFIPAGKIEHLYQEYIKL